MKTKHLLSASLLFISTLAFSQTQVGGSNSPIYYKNNNVGIGISSPAKRLAVDGGVEIWGETGGANIVGLIVYRPTENGNTLSRWGLMADLSDNASYPFLTNRTPNGKVVIKTGVSAGASENTHFTIEGGDNRVNAYFENVNLGIGTSNPTTLLSLNANTGGNDVGITQNKIGGPHTMEFTTADASASQATRILLRGTTDGSDIEFYRGGSGSETLSMFLEGDNGNVGIGIGNPSEKLVVDGKILAEEVRVENVPSSDYVFEPDYPLLPLSEVESYIKENKHLPDFPSAIEFKENGVGLGEMDNMLLRKLEELTLYVIELKKENERQNEIIQQQQLEINSLKKD